MTSEFLAMSENCRDRAEQLIDDKWAELIAEKHGSNKPEHFQTEDGWKLREQAKILLSKELSDLGFVISEVPHA